MLGISKPKITQQSKDIKEKIQNNYSLSTSPIIVLYLILYLLYYLLSLLVDNNMNFEVVHTMSILNIRV